MSFYAAIAKAYAKLCNTFLWPISRKISRRSPSIEMDFRRAAFPFSYEEYISMAIFTTAFMLFEVFAFSSTVVFLFEYNPVVSADVPQLPASVIAPSFEPTMEVISENAIMLTGEAVNFTVFSKNPSLGCQLEVNKISYTLALQKQGEECINRTINGMNAVYCTEPITVSQEKYNYSYSFVPLNAGEYNYSVTCAAPTFSSKGSVYVFEQSSDVSVSSEKYPITLIVFNGSKQVSSKVIFEDSLEKIPQGEITLKAVYEGADSSVQINVPGNNSVFFSFSFGKVNFSAPVKGTISFSRNGFTITESFDNSVEKELGAGSWEYELNADGFASKKGTFTVKANELTQEYSEILRKTKMDFSISPEKPATDEKFYININYTDSFGNTIKGFAGNVTVDGNPSTEESPGVYSYYLNASDEGVKTIAVMTSMPFFESQMKVITVNVIFNEARQSALKEGIRITLTIFLGLVTAFSFMLYPSQRADSRESSIDATLPFVLSHMSSMANSGISVSEIIKLMAKYCAYDEIRKEFSKMHKAMEILGYDLIKAIKTTADNTPSKKFSEILSSLATTIHSGGNISLFLKDRANSTRLDLTVKARERTSTMMLLGEIYIILFIAVPIFLAVMLIAMEFVSAGSLPIAPITILKLSAYAFIPIMTVVFIVYLMKELNAGI